MVNFNFNSRLKAAVTQTINHAQPHKYSKIMPEETDHINRNKQQPFKKKVIIVCIMLLSALSLPASAYEGLQTYYIRYDVKSSKNKIVDDHLLMVPAQNDFRAENFSVITVSGAISADPAGTGRSVANRIQEDCLQSVLVQKGLKSIKTKDTDTIISYEGVISAPVRISKSNYISHLNNFSYTAQVEFSPIAFPNRWDKLNIQFQLKQKLNDFFDLFH